jgi:putative ABC transport system permease protein
MMWILKMAWRDSRSQRGRLFLFMSSIVLGVAALVAINSLGENMDAAIQTQAGSLLGADLVMTSRQPFSHEADSLFAVIGMEQSNEVSFGSMAYFAKQGGTRLAQVRAVQGGFPYYGELHTEPKTAAKTFRSGSDALVDDGLLMQFNAQVGDSVKIGNVTFRIAGRLTQVAGEAVVAAMMGPRIYIPMQYLGATGLIQQGSRVSYKRYFKLDRSLDAEKLVATLKPQFEKLQLNSETIESRKAAFGQAFSNLYKFLSLVGFIALILGSVGVASAVHVYVKQKIGTMAVLRCLGASAKQLFGIYLVQTAAMGFIGSCIGVLLGVAVQTVLPVVIKDFLPVAVSFGISWKAVGQGLGTGLAMAVLFALLPLLTVRRISPLLAIRVSYEETGSAKDPLRWLIYGLMLESVVVFAMTQTGSVTTGVVFTLGIGVAFVLLASSSWAAMWLLKKYFPTSASYVWRQGLANLFRPNNQTLTMVLSLGLGTFLIATLYLSQETLLGSLASMTGKTDQPNLVLFDIQPDQKTDVEKLVTLNKLPVMQQVPIVTMRVSKVKGRTFDEIRKDSIRAVPEWTRELRCTYRDSLISTETLVTGMFQGRVKNSNDTVFVSVADSYAKAFELSLGDEIIFDVQGVPLTTHVGSIRKIDYRRVQPSFMVLFPSGVLEDAPQFWTLVTRTPSVEASSKMQQAVVKNFPNVSTIDLSLILSTTDAILSKVSFVVRFIALFSVVTGLAVLVGSMLTSRFQRIKESVLLRTLGASENQILKIMVLEYAFLGSLSALVGLGLATCGTWGLVYFFFRDVPFQLAVWPVAAAFAGVTALVVLVGLLNSRGIVSRPPLEILRTETAM